MNAPSRPAPRDRAAEQPKARTLSTEQAAAHPERVAIARKRTTFKNRRSPILDPITAAMLGYTRRGSGWVKNQNRSS